MQMFNEPKRSLTVRKVIYLIHSALDGIVAAADGALDWISYDEELEQYAHALHDVTDAVIWGRNTYQGMASYWLTVPGNPASTPAEVNHANWLQEATKIVVSRTLESVAWGGAKNTVLIKDNIAEQINKLKQQPGKDIWLLGSPNLAETFIQLDLIDEYRINVNPTVLGRGKTLFGGVNREMRLKLLEAKTFKSGVVGLRYEPARG
jgi:dihydrofolate reductase